MANKIPVATNCLRWSQRLLSDLLANQTILNGEGGLFIKTKNIQTSGEASVLIDKGILLFSRYHLLLVINLTGEAKIENGDKLADASGVVKVFISHGHKSFNLQFVNDEEVFGKIFMDACLDKVKAFVSEKIGVYADAMAKGGPVKDKLEVNKVSTEAVAGAGTKAVEATAVPVNKVEAKKEILDLDEILMDDKSERIYTSGNLSCSELLNEISPVVKLDAGCDESVTGTNLELQEGKLIVQNWRFGSWPDGLYYTALVFLFGVVFAILGVFAHLHFGFGGASTTLNFVLFIYWLMYVDRRWQFVRSMCALAAVFCFGAIASRYYGN